MVSAFAGFGVRWFRLSLVSAFAGLGFRRFVDLSPEAGAVKLSHKRLSRLLSFDVGDL